MRKLLTRLLNLGVPAEMSPEEAKYIQMGNLGSLLMIAVNLPYMALCLVHDWMFVFFELCLLNVLLSFTALINRLGRHILALFYFGTLLNLHLTFVTVAMGRESLLQLLIFFTAGGVITLLRRGELKLMVFALLGILGTYQVALVLDSTYGPIYQLTPTQMNDLRRFVEYSIFGLVVVNAIIGRVGAIAAEDRLREEQKRSERLLLRVQEQDRQKTQFFQNVSHELRTPITLILGPLENLQAEAGGVLDETARAKLQMVMRNAQRLLRMINQLLDLSKIDVGKGSLKLKWGDPTGLIHDLVSSFTAFAEKKNLRLTVKKSAGDTHLYYDQEILEKIVSNLLSNACKFTALGGEVTVNLSESEDRRTVCFSVKDTGIGIPRDQIEFIFDRFHQVDGSTTRTQEGTGIGLSLVKELVKMHGGNIEVVSEINHGSEFILSLPKGQAPRADFEKPNGQTEEEPSLAYARLESSGLESLLPARYDEAERHRADDRPLILIVEDNADMREYIRQGIEPTYRVAEAADGVEGLEKAGEFLPHLIISDVMMPRLDGLALCRALRDNEKLSQIPVILLTAKVSREMVIQGLESGAIDYITKPFSFDVLLARIKSILQREAEQEEMALRDGLTGLLNRMAWQQEVERELKKMSRFGGVASLVFLDLDDFKLINDTYGHPAGDQVLAELAKTVVYQLRASDLVGRYGGEEFVLYLPHSTGEETVKSIERILEGFRAKKIGERGFQCSFSAGVAEIKAGRVLGLAEYIARADAAMYVAKRAGKNTVLPWKETMEPN